MFQQPLPPAKLCPLLLPGCPPPHSSYKTVMTEDSTLKHIHVRVEDHGTQTEVAHIILRLLQVASM